MIFGLSGSKSSSKSQSTSEGFSESQEQAQSSGFSTGDSASVSGSFSGGSSIAGGESTSQQNVFGDDFFSRLFGDATNAAGGLDPSVLQGQASSLFGSGTSFLDQIGGGPGTEFLEDRVSGSSPVLQDNIDALGSDIGKFFQEQIMPGITSQGVATGTLGGGRQGVATGMATDAAAREFQRGALGLRTADLEARTGAAATLADQSIAGAGTGLAGIPGLSDVAQQGFEAGIAPQALLAQILGGPVALTDSQSTQQSSSEDFARAFSEAFSRDRAANQATSSGSSRAENRAQSTSSSKSLSVGVKFG